MSEYNSDDVVEVDEVFEPYLSVEAEADAEVYEVSEDELESARRSAVMDLHPDQGGHEEAFKRMNNSYEELSEIIDDSLKVTEENLSTTSQDYEDDPDPDYQVNQDGFIQYMDEMIRQVEQTVEELDRQMEKQTRAMAGSELDAMDAINQGEAEADEFVDF